MCQNSDININDMNEISSSTCNKKTVRFAVPRKIRKPLMERKRRARINLSLDELKRIVVEAEKLAGQDITCRVNKLEKADILEMTVKYLKRSVMPPTPNLGQMYLAGYKQCVEQLQDLLAEQWTDKGLQQTGQRMIEHLEARTQQLKVPRRYCSNDSSVTSSEPEDDEEEFIKSNNTTNNTNNTKNTNNHTTNTTRPSHNHSTHVGENPPKSMWRPW